MADLQLSQLYEEVRLTTQEVEEALGLVEKQVDDFLQGVDMMKTIWEDGPRVTELMAKSEGVYTQTVHANLASVHKLLTNVDSEIELYCKEKGRNAMLRELIEETRESRRIGVAVGRGAEEAPQHSQEHPLEEGEPTAAATACTADPSPATTADVEDSKSVILQLQRELAAAKDQIKLLQTTMHKTVLRCIELENEIERLRSPVTGHRTANVDEHHSETTKKESQKGTAAAQSDGEGRKNGLKRGAPAGLDVKSTASGNDGTTNGASRPAPDKTPGTKLNSTNRKTKGPEIRVGKISL